MRTNDPEVVRREYASEERFAVRRAVWETVTGPDVREIAFQAVAEGSPRRVLDVGCGMGELAHRMQRELGCDVIALDISPRMVELTRARGVDARVGDIQELPFPDDEFDCAIAAWMLYHVPDVNGALAELARVLRPGGRLVAVTQSEWNLPELWGLFGADAVRQHAFSSENGGEQLARHFRRVDRRDATGTVVFRDRAAVRAYVGASITRAHLADRLPELHEPLRATRAATVFVAEA